MAKIEATTNITIRLPADIKQQFEEFCDNVGISMSTAFNIFVRKVLRDNSFPFELGYDVPDVPDAETLEAIKEADRILAHPSSAKCYTSIAELMKDLNAEAVAP
ncbi:MAG TPA: type II toxin-antitoxin system RelB/DinJ family antitoxin [Candidatus Anaerobiospirillum stercoravium]|nr:type II toxin-antitoxin system RelB/DinJ family antitoxin [Candidatus Anaerobiospirillum stercoravium]